MRISEEWARQLIFDLTGKRDAERVIFAPALSRLWRVPLPIKLGLNQLNPSLYNTLEIEDIEIQKCYCRFGDWKEGYYIGYGEKSKTIVVCGEPVLLSDDLSRLMDKFSEAVDRIDRYAQGDLYFSG